MEKKNSVVEYLLEFMQEICQKEHTPKNWKKATTIGVSIY